ncbi:MAG TPA: hypothetical protein VGD37_33890 [Kofleriaceae bacterium]
MRALVAAVVACAACQGQPAGPAAVGSGSASGAAVPGPGDAGASDARASAAAGREPDAGGKPDEPEAADPGRVISELGAVPAWQAVVDRAQLLGRRGQHGVVYGRVGPAILVPGPPPPPAAPAPAALGPGVDAGVPPGPAVAAGAPPGPAVAAGAPPGPAVAAGAPPGPAVAPRLVASPYVWLVDDTEGNGSLGIRIALGGKAKEGDRIAAGGAWQLDAERRWFWKPDAVQPLPAAPPSDLKEPPPPAPSHAIATGDLPPGARTASVARDNDLVYFQIVGLPPVTDGDGWQVADQLGSPTVLVMNLPGERPSYGGQDMRAADERWQLRRGQTYWVRIGKLHRRGDKPPAVNARTAPIRVP